jgi:predicted aldo/keto reductase-like oxidoreductase
VKYGELGRTGLEVSELCYGTLILGRLQGDVPVAAGEAALRRALELGVNFFDTAQIYGTYGHLRAGLAGVTEAGGRPLVVASKTMARSAADARTALEQGLRECGRERFEVFLLHSVDGVEDLAARTGALEYLQEAQQAGLLGHLGISTHSVPGVLAALDHPELEVVLPILNQAGRGLRFGTMPEMVEATGKAFASGKGVYAMKALAGGHLGRQYQPALSWVRDLGCVHSLAVGMKSVAEVEVDVAFFEGLQPPADAGAAFYAEKRVKVIQACTGCGSCVAVCPGAALEIVEGKARCDPDRCLACGYCADACPNFAIRLV